MAIGTSTGAYFDDAFHQATSSYIEDPASTPDNNEVSPNDVKEKKDYQQGRPIRASDTIQPGERLYVSPNDIRAPGASPDMEDQRDQSPLGMVASHIKEQLTTEKLKAILQHPNPFTAPPVWQTETANQPVTETPLGNDLGLSSIPSTMPPGAPTEAAGALKQSGGSLPTPDPQNASTGFLGRLSIVNALRGMTNPSTEEDKNILSGIGSAIGSAVTLPGDEMAGKVQPDSPEEVERVNNLAGFMVGAPAPVASKMADGTLGSFAGVNSKTINSDVFFHAQKMAEEGAHPDDIWEHTGFFKGADDKWRYEIPDDKAALNEDKIEQKYKSLANSKYDSYGVKDPEGPGGHKLEDVLHHPELYKAYPELKDINVKPVPPMWSLQGIQGGFDDPSNTLYIGAGSKQRMLSTTLHEIQHAIQAKEGFSLGSNTDMFIPEDLEKLFTKFQQVKTASEQEVKDLIDLHGNKFKNLPTEIKKTSVSTTPKGWGDEIGWGDSVGDPDIIYRNIATMMRNKDILTADDKNLMDTIRRQYPEIYDKIQSLVKANNTVQDKKDQLLELYRRTRGEVEARNVQKRLEMENLDRYGTHPYQTEDRPRFVQHEAPEKRVGTSEHRTGIEHTNYPKIPKNESEELEQLMETRRTNKLMGYDVDSPDYDYYNKRIQELQKKTKKK